MRASSSNPIRGPLRPHSNRRRRASALAKGARRRGQETESGAAASILRGQRCYNRGVDVRLRDSGRRRETQTGGGGGGERKSPLLRPAAITLGRVRGPGGPPGGPGGGV